MYRTAPRSWPQSLCHKPYKLLVVPWRTPANRLLFRCLIIVSRCSPPPLPPSTRLTPVCSCSTVAFVFLSGPTSSASVAATGPKTFLVRFRRRWPQVLPHFLSFGPTAIVPPPSCTAWPGVYSRPRSGSFKTKKHSTEKKNTFDYSTSTPYFFWSRR